jgi:SAM-dependent methyltransferase
MTVTERWKQAQVAENEFWSGLTAPTIRQILRVNESYAAHLQDWVRERPSPALEIGVGGLGVGLLGFVPSLATRIAVDPLPHIQPAVPETLLEEILLKRAALQFARASGESLPFANEHFALVACVNVLDHVNNAPEVVAEVFRVLRPGGLFFLGVDTFSFFGLAKWHLLTKHLRASEILVRAHPYRFLESHVARLGRTAGFQLERVDLRGFLARWIGHSRMSCFLFKKPIASAN